MTQSRPVQNTMSSGEIDPLLNARSDFQRNQTGLGICRGFLPLPQGGVTRAPGTIFRGRTRGNLKARRISFEFAINDSLSLEFTDGIMRVWRYGALVQNSGGGDYELATPYTEADLPNLEAAQDGDLVYLVDGRQPMQKLSRFALDNWTIEDAPLVNGPFRVQNLDEAQTIQCSSVYGEVAAWTSNEVLANGDVRKFGQNVYTFRSSGSCGPNPPTHTSGTQSYVVVAGSPPTTVDWEFSFATASSGLIDLTSQGFSFDSTHVGVLFLLKPTDYKNIPIWVGNTAATVGTKMRYDGNIYELTAGSNTGVSPPVHTTGAVRTDASKPTEWTWVSDEVGVVRITSVASATSATADVLKTIPEPCIDSPTHRWSEGAWNQKYGYPRHVEFDNRDLYVAATPSEPRTLWKSTQSAPMDFEPSDLAGGSFAYILRGKGEIQWLKSGRRGIYIGRLSEVHRGFSDTPGEAIGPLTFTTELVSEDGVAAIKPIAPYGFPVYISSDLLRANEIRYDFQQDGSKPLELSIASKHLAAAFFVDMAWQRSPHRHGWIRRGDGQMVNMVYDPDHDVLGWATLPVADGFVEDIDVTRSADGAFDVLTMIVRRTINGVTERFIEEQAINIRALLGAEPATHFNHAFASSVFEPAPATDTFDMSHLIGEAVYAWTDQGQFGPMTVPAGGQLVLPQAVGRAVIGLFDASHMIETLDVRAAAPDGDSRGRQRRLDSGAGLMIHMTGGGTVQAVERHFNGPEIAHDAQQIFSHNVADDALELASGTLRINAPTGHADTVHMRILPEGLAPMTITAIIPNVEEAGA